MDESNKELYEMIDREYGHSYIPDFFREDVHECARAWKQTPLGAGYVDAYYAGMDKRRVTIDMISEDFEDLITDWLAEELEAWQNAE